MLDEKGIYAQNYIHSMGQPMKIKGFPDSSAGKESTRNAGDLGLIPGLGRSPRERDSLATPVFWPREFHGLYSPRHRKESDTTE